jgi:hypothetical protein
MTQGAFFQWVEAAFDNALHDVTWSELARSLTALSADYVHRRARLRTHAFDGRGKRAAFATYYAPRHYILVRELMTAVDPTGLRPDHVVDLGCGTGAASAAWLTAHGTSPHVTAIDVLAWAVAQARTTYAAFGIAHRVVCTPLERFRWASSPAGIVAAFTVNEIDDRARDALQRQLQQQARSGSTILVLEPLAKRAAPWWDEWVAAFDSYGGRALEYRIPTDRARELLPERVIQLGRSAHLDPLDLSARALWVASRPV